jgi:formylglycine-generating enzyme required for sulfatase activity
MELAAIAPGKFLMGSPPNDVARFGDMPQREVVLSTAFWMGKYEVTQTQYLSIMHETPSAIVGEIKPVNFVSWEQATGFCAKLTQIEGQLGRLPLGYVYRLPTEAEWEYCCRAGSQTAYCYGDDPAELGNYAWFADNRPPGRLADVGMKKPNAWGLYDMHGNAWEWCHDKKGSYSSATVGDLGKQQPEVLDIRVSRGGGVFSRAHECRSASRSGCEVSHRSPFWGFRVVLGPALKNE